jgi:hypothetical protein
LPLCRAVAVPERPFSLAATHRILGEYAIDGDLLAQSFNELLTNVGQPPFVPKVVPKEEEAPPATPTARTITKSVVLSDGTYATQVVQSLMDCGNPPGVWD